MSRWVLLTLSLLPGACGDPEGGADRDPDRPAADGGADAGSAQIDGGDGGPGISAASCTDITCDAHASCSQAGAQATCRCNSGYTGDGFSCSDVDECAANDSDCDAHASCANTVGGFACTCDTGYTGDGKSCDDVDECATSALLCDINGLCNNTEGGASCSCNPGYTANGAICDDADECADPTYCNLKPNTTCVNTPGSAFCDCSVGFHFDSVLSACAPNTACPSGNSDCDTNATCVSGACECAAGYDGHGGSGGGGCVNIDECALGQDTCHSAATCTDADPSSGKPFTCGCKPGFSGDGTTCADIDECADDTDDCAGGTPAARCTNTIGGYTCICPDGFTGEPDAKTACVNLNECSSASLNDCHVNARCTDKTPDPNASDPVKYTCKCKTGFTGDGTTYCDDIDECMSGAHDCTGGETCTNIPGAWMCGCNPPYTNKNGKCYCDLSGYFGMRQDLTTTWDAVVLNPGNAVIIEAGSYRTTVWELHRYRYDGTTLKTEKKGCGSAGTPDLVSGPLLGSETFGSYVPTAVWDAFAFIEGTDVPLPNAKPGSTFDGPKEAAVLGIDLANPLTDSWPASSGQVANADRLDADGDGIPGLTMWPRTPADTTHAGGKYSYVFTAIDLLGKPIRRATCVASASRVVNANENVTLTGTSCTDLEFVGDVVNYQVDGRVYDCRILSSLDGDQLDKVVTCTKAAWDAGRACSTADINTLDNQTNKPKSTATFELVRLGSDPDATNITCATVRTTLPAL